MKDSSLITQPTLYILCGIPFSGKTYLAHKLSKKLGLTHINVDDFITRTSLPITELHWQRAFNQAFKLTRNELARHISVVFDATNYLLKERNKLHQIAQDQRATSLTIYIKTPIKIAYQRWQQNNINHSRHLIPESDFNQVCRDIEPPTPPEPYLIFQHDDVFSKWVNHLL